MWPMEVDLVILPILPLKLVAMAMYFEGSQNEWSVNQDHSQLYQSWKFGEDKFSTFWDH